MNSHPYEYQAFTAWRIKINGDLHREDGPAVIWRKSPDVAGQYAGSEDWYLNNELIEVDKMPMDLYLAYLKWELKKHGK